MDPDPARAAARGMSGRPAVDQVAISELADNGLLVPRGFEIRGTLQIVRGRARVFGRINNRPSAQRRRG
jgi:hypothetical protein